MLSMLSTTLALALLLPPPRVAPAARSSALLPARRHTRRAGEPLQQLAMQQPSPLSFESPDVPVDIDVTGMNSRCISASIVVSASPAQVWSILTGARRVRDSQDATGSLAALPAI